MDDRGYECDVEASDVQTARRRVVHDFNNLLTVIIGYSDVALDLDDVAEIHAAVGQIAVAARRARLLSDRMAEDEAITAGR